MITRPRGEPVVVSVAGGAGPVDAHPADSLSPTEVGEWYVGSRSLHADPRVVDAYRRLEAEVDGLFTHLFSADGPTGVRCAFTRCRQPYGSDRELIAAVRTDRVLEMTTSTVTDNSLHPLLGSGFGGAFDRFRAVHDLIGHAVPGLGFDLDGELSAWRAQRGLHSGPAQWALATELVGVNCARWLVGEPPELRALLLGRHPCGRALPGGVPPVRRCRR